MGVDVHARILFPQKGLRVNTTNSPFAERSFEILSDLPSAGERYFFPGASSKGGKDGLNIKFQDGDRAWIGTFARGEAIRRAKTGVFQAPWPGWFLVVAQGEGYLVDPEEPANCQHLGFSPITAIIVNPSTGQMALGGLTSLLALDIEGECWQTEQLVCDGFEIKSFDQDEIQILGEVIPGEGPEIIKIKWGNGQIKQQEA